MKYSVRWKADKFYRFGSDPKWEYARYDTNPNRRCKIKFDKRQDAAQWVRNHRWEVDSETCTILHPDGTEELFYPGNRAN